MLTHIHTHTHGCLQQLPKHHTSFIKEHHGNDTVWNMLVLTYLRHTEYQTTRKLARNEGNFSVEVTTRLSFLFNPHTKWSILKINLKWFAVGELCNAKTIAWGRNEVYSAVAKYKKKKDEGHLRRFVPLVDNEVHLIELPLGDCARGNQQTHT